MQLKHLRTFVAVASTLNLTRAGEKLHLAQSSVSEQIQSLETDLGTTLFDRSKRKWGLTPPGERLLEYASAITSSGVRYSRSRPICLFDGRPPTRTVINSRFGTGSTILNFARIFRASRNDSVTN